MATSEQLLHVVARLQNVQSVAQGRQMLLAHLRKVSAAQLAIIFTVDSHLRQLNLLAASGRRPYFPQQRPVGSPNRKHIPLDGLFGSVLYMHVPLLVSDLHNDARALYEERAWAWPGGRVILSAIKADERPDASLGLLALCFHPQISGQSGGEYEDDLLIGSMLLSTYLTNSEEPLPEATHNRRAVLPARTAARGGQRTLSETTHNLSPLNEASLAIEIGEERKRIAFDIHDGAAQRITHALQKLDLLRRTLEKQDQPLMSPVIMLDEVNHIYSILERSLQDLRQNISSLLPPQLEERGFSATLDELLDELRADEPGLELSCQVEKPALLPTVLEGSILRFIQEALNNVRKHAQATHVALRMRMLSGSLVVEVSDNGRGFRPAEEFARSAGTMQGERVGLRAMRERIEAQGGNWEVQSKPGEGTTLRARFPLNSTSILLTEREREVLRLVVEGLTNRAIAERLSVSIETIKSHMHHIMQKMQVRDRTQAAVTATRQHWLYPS